MMGNQANLQHWVSLALGILIVAGLFTSRKLALWSPVTGLVNRLKVRMSSLLRQRSLRSSFVLGLLNGLLPCGLVYVACAGAMAIGTIAGAIGYMAAFGTGTIPMMLAIGLSGRLVPVSFRMKLRAAIPISVFLLGALLVLRGMSLGVPYLSPNLSQPGANCCQK